MEGLDYFETFAFICKLVTFRILPQLSAKQDHVKTVFLQSRIDEEVHLDQPQEFVKQ